jgi:hypothetical protein
MTTRSFSSSRRLIAISLAVSITVGASLFAPTVNAAEHIPYQSVINMTGNCTAQGATVCSFNFAAVPHGRRLVVEQVSGLLTFAPFTLPALVVTINEQNGQILQSFSEPPSPISTLSSSTLSAFIQPTLFYIDAGNSFSVQLAAYNAGQFAPGPAAQFVSATGYLVKCEKDECPEVAH